MRAFLFGKDYQSKAPQFANEVNSSRESEIKPSKASEEIPSKIPECCTSEESPSSKTTEIAIYSHSYLPDECQKDFFRKKSTEWKDYSTNLVDSHCHFEMLFYRFIFALSNICIIFSGVYLFDIFQE